jgi:serine/threonine-protein kinase
VAGELAVRGVRHGLLGCLALVLTCGSFASAAAQPASPSPAEHGSTDAEAETPPDADGKLAEAKALFDAAQAAREQGDVEGALTLFRRSKELVPSPYNEGGEARCLDLLGKSDEAANAYEALKTRYAATMPPDSVAAVDARLAELRMTLGLLRVTGPAGARLTLDDRDAGVLPERNKLWVLPGEHRLVVSHGARVLVERSLTVRAQAEIAIVVEEAEPITVAKPTAPTTLPPRPSSTPPDAGDPTTKRALLWAGGVTTGLGVVGLAIGTYFGARAIERKGASDDALVEDRCFDACFEAWEEGRDAAAVANVTLGVGGALAGVGVVLLVVAATVTGDESGSASLSPLIAATTKGATLGAAWRW